MSKFQLARISAVHKGSFSVLGEYGEVPAEVTGNLVYNADSSIDYPAVGDWVKINYFDNNTFAVINEIRPRKSILKRKTSGKQTEYQVIAANVDMAFIVQSMDQDFNLNRMERYLVMVTEGKIRPVILLSKKDLIPVQEFCEQIKALQVRIKDSQVIVFSNKTGEGLTQIKAKLKKDKIYCLIGSSGVGKSTLLNSLLGEEAFATMEVRKKDGRGRHTTARRQLIALKNGALMIDTPGMRELGNIEISEGLRDTFDEIEQLQNQCRFSDCTHTKENGCAVLKALAEEKLSKVHYQNYIKLKKESEYNKMTYLDKRRKNKDFGKMVKRVMKDKKISKGN